jgi:hypothetical protein
VNDRELAALLLAVADSFESRDAGSSVGIIRIAARRLAELERQAAWSGAGGCEWCGAELEQPGTGRPRRFCSDAHRRAAGGNGGKSMLAKTT